MKKVLFLMVLSLFIWSCEDAPTTQKCTSGDSRPCYSGALTTKDVGVCKSGEQSCGTTGTWGECKNQVLPTDEVCFDNLDNNCDGVKDEDCGECLPESTEECYSKAESTKGVGVCKAGTKTCSSEKTWGECVGEVIPTDEICDDGLDNNCDGVIDENCGECTPDETKECYSGAEDTKGVGSCQAGVSTCLADKTWGACVGEVLPTDEICDGMDNNCDGSNDNNLDAPDADKQAGVCADQKKVCMGVNGWQEPNYSILTNYESEETLCDGVDNDCDGTADNNLVAPLSDRQNGVCADSKKRCDGVNGWSEPNYTSIIGYEANELTCDGLDNDCDNETDENLIAPSADKTAGVCANSKKVCNGVDGWSEPNYSLLTDYEDSEVSCDGKDNDCNGTPDDGLVAPDADKHVGICTGQKKVCDGGNGWIEPIYNNLDYYEPTETSCDDRDNDCDGDTDEDYLNTDGDAQANCVDEDDDNDGVVDANDNCPLIVNGDNEDSQLDTDSDGIGNMCDDDDDNDGVLDTDDNCPLVKNGENEDNQLDTDEDGLGDLCDICKDDPLNKDTDGDGVLDCVDNCVYTANTDQENVDGDSKGAACDCDDNDDTNTPTEICNGKDDDCNGVIDEEGVCPSDCRREEYNNHIYLFCSEEVSWNSAKAKCNNINYTLVKIEDADENNWIDEKRDARSIIGLNDIKDEDVYRWSDDSGASLYFNWYDGEPNDEDGEDCSEIFADAEWNDIDCDTSLRKYICENNTPIHKSCKDILDSGVAIDGVYTIDPDGIGGNNPFQVYCDMTTDGGGWMLVASWTTDYNWTKFATSTNELLSDTPKNRVSSNFGDMKINEFRVMASEELSLTGANAKGDWSYHYNTSVEWKKVWAPRAHSLSSSRDCSNGYVSSSDTPRQSIKEFNYSKNIKFNYTNSSHHWNNLSDWGYTGNDKCGSIANYWKALTTSGENFGVFQNSYDINGGPVSDGTLAIAIKNNSGLKTGQDINTNYNTRVGYDDGKSCARYGTTDTDTIFTENNTNDIHDSTKLWWFIR